MIVGLPGLPALVAALALNSTAPLPHADLRASDPAQNSHLTVAPRRITLWFTSRPSVALSHIKLIGPAGEVSLGKLTADTGNALRADVVGELADGTYKVEWHAASADGHPVAGEFSFMVATNPAIPAHTSPLPQTRSSLTDAPPAGARLVRLLEFIALLLVLGVFVFVHGVLPPLAARGVHTTDASLSARTLGSGAATIYIAAAIGRLLMEAAELRMPGEATASVLPGISDSSWGHGWVVGVVGAGLVVIGLLLSRRRIAAGTPIALTGALAMALSPALTGHAASAQWFVASVTLDGLHVASVGSWLGTLAVVVLIGIPAMARVKDGNADAAVSALVNSFHPIALLSAPMAVFAGLGSSALRLGSLAALTSSRYGSVLIWKLGAVALVAAMGTWNSTRARKRLGTPSATQGIRWTAATEVILAVLVLWVTTDLTATPAPSEMVAP